jgi:hypothetical protein
MNKIEKAIYDVNLKLKDLERIRTNLIGEINAYKDCLDTLEVIKDNKHIPNEETKVSETFLNSNK